MKENYIYKIENEFYLCLKELSFINYEFTKSIIEYMRYNDLVEIKEDEIIKLMKNKMKIHNNFIMIKVSKINKKDVEKEIESLNYGNLFKYSSVSFISDENKSIIVLDDEEIKSYNKIGKGKSKRWQVYNEKINEIIQEFIGINEYTEEKLFNIIKHEIINLILNYFGNRHSLLSFQERVNLGLMALSLRHGVIETNDWYLEQLNNYRINKLINAI